MLKNRIKRTASLISAAFVLLTLLPLSAAVTAESGTLIRDGGMENTQFFSNSEVSCGWRYNNSCRAVLSENYAAAGKSSAEVTSTSAGYATLSYNGITAEKNTDYILSFLLYIESAGEKDFRYSVLSGTKYVDSVKNITVSGNTGEWITVTKEFNSGAYTDLTLQLCPYGSGVYYIDSVYMGKRIDNPVYISAAAENGGYIYGAEAGIPYAAGSEVTVSAYPFAGYGFEGWFSGDECISTEKTLKLTLNKDTALTAKFAAGLSQSNLAVNGDFESGDFSGYIAEEGAEIITNENGSLLRISGDTKRRRTIRQKITVQPNEEYILSFGAECAGAGSAAFYITDNNGKLITGGSITDGGKGRRRVSFTSKTDSVWLTFFSGTEQTDIDDIIVSRPVNISFICGENGIITGAESGKYAVGEVIYAAAQPNDGYAFSGWYSGDTPISNEREIKITAERSAAYSCTFRECADAVMTAFDTDKLNTAEENNLISRPDFESAGGAEWSTECFLKAGVSEIAETDKGKSFYFHPCGDTAETVYFPITVLANTDYMLAFDVRGENLGKENAADATFGIMNPQNGEYIIIENPVKGTYYDETPNSTATRSLTPPSWDGMWHRRGCTFTSGGHNLLYIAVSGKKAQMYLDDITLCLLENAATETESAKTAISVQSLGTQSYTAADSANSAFNWADPAINVWGGKKTGTDISLKTDSSGSYIELTPQRQYPTYSCFIKWFSVLPGRSYKLSLETRLNGGAVYIAGGKNSKVYTVAEFTDSTADTWQPHSAILNSGDETEIGILLRDNGKSAAFRNVVLTENSAPPAQAGENILQNGGFESGNADGIKYPAAASGFTVTDEKSKSGLYSLKIGAEQRYNWAYFAVSVKKNTWYTYTFYGYRTVAAKSAIYKILNPATKNPVAGTQSNYWINGNGKWELNRVIFNSGNTDKIWLAFTEDGAAAYADDLHLSERIMPQAAASRGGGISGISQNGYQPGEVIRINAAADAGYRFAGWYSGDIFLSNNTQYIAAAESGISVIARFLPQTGTLLGDVNGDDNINSQDSALLKKHLLGIDCVISAGADVNADTFIDIRDATALKKKLAALGV